MSGRRAEHINLETLLRMRMNKMKEKNKLPLRGAFIDKDYLQGLFTIENLQQRLKNDLHDVDQKTIEEWAHLIRNRRPKLYAILILNGMADRIVEFPAEDISLDDEQLFNSGHTGSKPCSRESFKQPNIPADLADVLYDNQWIVPPTISATKHHTFPPDAFMFPFTDEPELLGRGSFGHVYEVGVADGHLNFPEWFPSRAKVAYKKVKRTEGGPTTGKRLMREVEILRQREHPNILPLLASFSAGRERARRVTDSDVVLYLISPIAAGNMKNWIKVGPPHIESRQEREDLGYRAMQDVASGLAFIHRVIDGKKGFHRDLKPSNILQFLGGSFPTWKICDFGSAKLMNAVDETSTSNTTGTVIYAPPEVYYNSEPLKRGEAKHGRAYDVWSLGCVFLELLTVMKYGWGEQGMERFEQMRLADYIQNVQCHEDDIPCSPQDDVSTETKQSALSFQRNIGLVWKWIDLLIEMESPIFRRVALLIKEMLTQRPQERIFAWEVVMEFLELFPVQETTGNHFKCIEEIIQPPGGPNSGYSIGHNPLIRAISKEKPKEILDMLKKFGWSDHAPRPTGVSRTDWYSNLPMLEEGIKLFGMQDVDRKISANFESCKVVGLWGLGGIGKTYMALYYSLQFQKTSKPETKRHTFWVSANSCSSIHKDYQKILESVGQPIPKSNDALRVALCGWLSNDANGPWLLVIDGVETESVSQYLNCLPASIQKGQVLITTRNRQFLTEFVEKEQCKIRIESPEAQDYLRIFRKYLDDKWFDADPKEMNSLLTQLHTPLMVRLVAKHMNEVQMACSELLEKVKDNPDLFTRIGDDYLQKQSISSLLAPVIQKSGPDSSRWPATLRLLCLLAIFDKDGIEENLIAIRYPKNRHGTLRRRIGLLLNCAFIEKRVTPITSLGNETHSEEPNAKQTWNNTHDGGTTYTMPKVIQDSVIYWIRDQKTEIGLFERIEEALAMLLDYYKLKNKQEERVNLTYRASYQWKRPYMPHFERIAAFIRQATSESDRRLPPHFKLRARAVDAIALFSRVYLDEGWYDTAFILLEFAKTHAFEQPQVRVEPERTLVKACYACSWTPEALKYSKRAVRILRNMISEIEQERPIEEELEQSSKRALLRCNLRLELVRLYYELKQLKQAQKECNALSRLTFTVARGQAVLPNHTKDTANLEDKERKIIAIKVRHEQGQIEIHMGQNYFEKNQHWLARRRWRAARGAFEETILALKQWAVQEAGLMMEVESSLADANYKLGTSETLAEAHKTLKNILEKLQGDLRGSDKRIWDTKRRLAMVSLEGTPEEARDAVSTLRCIFDTYTSVYGEKNGETRRAAIHLRKGYHKIGDQDQIHRLETT